MRGALVGTFVMLAIGMGLAQTQEQPAQTPGTLFKVTPPASEKTFKVNPLPLVPGEPVDGSGYDVVREIPFLPGADSCFTMRTYFFSKGGTGTPPHLKGYATCIPSSKLQIRQTGPPVKFVPQ